MLSYISKQKIWLNEILMPFRDMSESPAYNTLNFRQQKMQNANADEYYNSFLL